jgi:HlyD family secretion protein
MTGWSIERPSRWKRLRSPKGVAITSCIAALAVAFAPVVWPATEERGVQTATVRRASFETVVIASGRLESTQSTEIRCTLERLSGAAQGASTILSLVPDGSMVKKGDLLCELDSADYVELVRQQTINVQQARAAFRQTELTLQVAEIALQAYRDGELRETDRLYRGQIALAQSDLARQKDRLKWVNRMVEKGYYSSLQVSSETQTMRRLELTLAQLDLAFTNYRRFSAPKGLRAYESDVNAAKANHDFQSIKLRREEEKLANYKSMVERCTVRAPHDGFALYANRPDRPPQVDVGLPVRQRQQLFNLPDLSRMEVQALLHETVVNRVHPGMPVRVRLEALPGLELEGEVESVSPLPLMERKQERNSDVTYFLGRVRLSHKSEGLRPGMSAEVEIMTTQRQGVLAVPPTAVTDEGGRDVCYVIREDRLEPRQVVVGQSSHDLVEVAEGLREGETVLLDASLFNPASSPPTDPDAE